MLARSREAGAGLAGRRRRCWSRRTRRRAGRPKRVTLARGGRRPTIRSSTRRSPTSTARQDAGRTRPTRTSRRCRRRRAASICASRYASALLNAGGAENVAEGARRAARSAGRRAAPTSARCICCRRPSGGRAIWTRPKARAAADRAEPQQPAGLRGARRGARGAAAVSGRRRRAGAGGVASSDPAANAQRRRSACCCRTSASRTSSSGKYDKAIATFEEAQKLAPDDPARHRLSDSGQPVGARSTPRPRRLARAARARSIPTICGSRGSKPQALRQSGQGRSGRSPCSQDVVQKHGDDPAALHRAGAGLLGREPRRAGRQGAAGRAGEVPGRADVITFELGAVLEKQKKFADAEAAFRQLLARSRTHAPALNYLGYMLAERGERLDESVDATSSGRSRSSPTTARISTASAGRTSRTASSIWPPSSLKRAADQLTTNSVIQDHYGDVLFKLGRVRRGDRRVERARSPATATRSIAATSTRRSGPPGRSFRRNDARAVGRERRSTRGARRDPRCGAAARAAR